MTTNYEINPEDPQFVEECLKEFDVELSKVKASLTASAKPKAAATAKSAQKTPRGSTKANGSRARSPSLLNQKEQSVQNSNIKKTLPKGTSRVDLPYRPDDSKPNHFPTIKLPRTYDVLFGRGSRVATHRYVHAQANLHWFF